MAKFNLKQIKERAAQADSEPTPQKTSKTESQNASITEEPDVNLTINVKRSHRVHWAGQAKLQGTSLTAIIKEALEARFGLPEDQ